MWTLQSYQRKNYFCLQRVISIAKHFRHLWPFNGWGSQPWFCDGNRQTADIITCHLGNSTQRGTPIIIAKYYAVNLDIDYKINNEQFCVHGRFRKEGHQDDHTISALDWWGQMKLETDTMAKAFIQVETVQSAFICTVWAMVYLVQGSEVSQLYVMIYYGIQSYWGW